MIASIQWDMLQFTPPIYSFILSVLFLSRTLANTAPFLERSEMSRQSVGVSQNDPPVGYFPNYWHTIGTYIFRKTLILCYIEHRPATTKALKVLSFHLGRKWNLVSCSKEDEKNQGHPNSLERCWGQRHSWVLVRAGGSCVPHQSGLCTAQADSGSR